MRFTFATHRDISPALSGMNGTIDPQALIGDRVGKRDQVAQENAHISPSSNPIARFSNYEFTKKIGQGSFGSIYKGVNVKTGEPVVVKTESARVEYSSLKHESIILNILYSKSCRNIPPTYWYGVSVVNGVSMRCLVMPYYSESLTRIYYSGLSMNAFQNIMRSAILILKSIHDKYVVHRDLKPANWMIRDDELVLIDFGLSMFYMDAEERHIPPARKHHIIGTPKYASWNILGGEEYSRRDDLMSIAYIGLFLMEGSDLWADFERPDANRECRSRSLEKCSNERSGITGTIETLKFSARSPTSIVPGIPELTGDRLMNGVNVDKTHIMHPMNQWFFCKKTVANVVEQSKGWPALQEFSRRVYALSFQERPDYDQYAELFT